MSIGISILLPEKKLTKGAYLAFLNECAKVKGEYEIYEFGTFNLNLDTVQDCVLREKEGKHIKPNKSLRVYVTLNRISLIKKYGRSRRQYYWSIYTETKMGRTIWDTAVQLAIPFVAFQKFADIVVLAEGDRKVFFEPKTYTVFAKQSLLESFSEKAAIEAGFIDSEGSLLLP